MSKFHITRNTGFLPVIYSIQEMNAYNYPKILVGIKRFISLGTRYHTRTKGFILVGSHGT